MILPAIGFLLLTGLGAGIGILVNRKFEIPIAGLIFISILGLGLLVFGIWSLGMACLVDGCSQGIFISLLSLIFVGFELLVAGLAILIYRKTQ